MAYAYPHTIDNGAGERITFLRRVSGPTGDPGPDELACTGFIEPADNVEFYLGAIFASARARGGPVPDPFDAAFLATRYRSEFTMAVIPAPVRRFAFPVIVAVGTLLGKYRKYADAPERVRR